jgi:hypothetical protein
MCPYALDKAEIVEPTIDAIYPATLLAVLARRLHDSSRLDTTQLAAGPNWFIEHSLGLESKRR